MKPNHQYVFKKAPAVASGFLHVYLGQERGKEVFYALCQEGSVLGTLRLTPDQAARMEPVEVLPGDARYRRKAFFPEEAEFIYRASFEEGSKEVWSKAA